MRCAGSIVVTLLLAGCIGPQETRYLKWWPRRSDVEARSYDWHDPFPDERAGPGTQTRPRQFLAPRTDTRKDYDQRYLQSVHPTAGTQYAAGPDWPGIDNPGMSAGNGYPQPYSQSPPGPVAGIPNVQ